MLAQGSYPHRQAALGAVAAGNFMVQLAMMPVSTVLPTVAGHFAVEPAIAAWVMTAYLLTLTGLVLTTGRLGDHYGYRRTFRLGVILFALGAVVAGLAPQLATLIVGRAVQGIGGALMLGNALAIIVTYVPATTRARSIGLAAIAASIGSLAGVAVAAYLIDSLTWRGVFLIVAPSSLVGLWFVGRLPDDRRGDQAAGRLDLAGAALLFLLLTSLSLSFTHLHGGEASFEAGWPYHSVMHALTALLLAAFIVVESRARLPMMPLHLFRHRRFTMAILANCALHMTMMGSMFLVPFLVEHGLGRPPSTTGSLLIPMQLIGMSASYGAGWLYDRTRSPLIAPSMLVIIGSSFLLLGLQASRQSELELLLLLAVVGAATNIFMTANNTAALTALPRRLAGFSSGMLETSRQLGHSIAVALAAGVLGAAAETGGTAAPHATASLAVSILSFGLIAFIGAGLAAFGGEARSRQSGNLAASASD